MTSDANKGKGTNAYKQQTRSYAVNNNNHALFRCNNKQTNHNKTVHASTHTHGHNGLRATAAAGKMIDS